MTPITLLPLRSLLSTTGPRDSIFRTSTLLARRHLSSPPSPHAYLRILSDGKDASPELDGVMCLVLDRPQTKNALSVQMVSELRESIAKVASLSSARALLLHTPHPKLFCAGADLAERRTMSPAEVSTFLYSLRYLIQELEDLPIPTIGVVDGYALGGGCELALGCDIRVGGANTIISLPEAKLGIIPGAGGTQRLTRLVGTAKAKELIFTGRRVGGVEAERIGLVNSCAEAPSTAWDAALLLARQIMTSGNCMLPAVPALIDDNDDIAPLALSASKKAINSSFLPLDQGLDLERQIYNSLLRTEDRQEGLMAFAQKRRAIFQGR
ncbi:hypothetical protein P7C73_g125, partial [Tremellales sp. Uapishka_1]